MFLNHIVVISRTLKQLSLTLVIYFFGMSLNAQSASVTSTCFSGGCVVASNITFNGVNPGTSPGAPPWIEDGEVFEVCYEVTGWNFLNSNWFHGAEPEVGAGLIQPDGNSNVTNISGDNETWIWSPYCTINCCDSSGDNTTTTPNNVCGPPSTGAWLFGVDSADGLCDGASPNDGELSNNTGDSGSGPWEFCLEIEATCGGITNGSIASEVLWKVYGDSDMGTWGYGNPSNNCACEGGAVECGANIDIVCCQVPELSGAGPNENEPILNEGSFVECASEIISLSVEGDIDNPDYFYEWEGPFGSGPNSAIWDVNSSTPLPIPVPTGTYELTVVNTAFNNCERTFYVEIIDNADAPECSASFEGIVAFEGYQGANGMSTTYADNNLLPNSQPFNVPPFNYNGLESFEIAPLNAVDWVLVELRDASDESVLINTKAALVNSQGEIVDTDDNLGVNFGNNAGDYFVAIHHQGHVPIISAIPLSLPINAPFTFSSNNVNGSNQMKTVGGVDVMIAGDYDNNNTVNFGDFILWLSNNNALNTYASFDADGNGTVNFFDFILWLGNNNHLAYPGI